MIRRRLAGAGRTCAVVLTVACQTSAPSPDVVVPSQIAPPAPAQPRPAAPPPAPPVTATALLDRVRALAVKLGPGLSNEDVEQQLDVHLARDDAGFSGVSRSWPARVLYMPAVDQKEASLHVSFDDFGSVTIADLEKRFGPAEYHVDAKEGLARYRVAPDASLRVKYLGGWNPSSPVSGLRLEPANRKPPPPGDLFK